MASKSTKLGKSFQKHSGRLFSALPLTPNQITILSIVPAILGFLAAYYSQPWYALLLFMAAGAIDAIDGAVARAKSQVTARGAFIDGMTDRVVELFMVTSFVFFALPPFILPAAAWLVVYLFFGSAMTGFASAYAEHRHVADEKKIAKQPGILPRAERLILLFLALFIIPYSPALASFIIFSGAVLAVITFMQRLAYFAK